MSSESRIIVPKGGYGIESIYNIVQHKYAGGGHSGCGGYIEVLEIKDSPDKKCGIIVHEYLTHIGHTFTEWQTLKDALFAYDKCWGNEDNHNVFPTLTGFIRRVVCRDLTPWFYAQNYIAGDYVPPVGYLF